MKKYVSLENLSRFYTKLKGTTLDTLEEIQANKTEGKIAGALAVKELANNGKWKLLGNSTGTKKITISSELKGEINELFIQLKIGGGGHIITGIIMYDLLEETTTSSSKCIFNMPALNTTGQERKAFTAIWISKSDVGIQQIFRNGSDVTSDSIINVFWR